MKRNLGELIRYGDKLFNDSPDAGDPTCLCSRCERPITEAEGPPVRIWLSAKREEEYRYHVECLGLDDDPTDGATT